MSTSYQTTSKLHFSYWKLLINSSSWQQTIVWIMSSNWSLYYNTPWLKVVIVLFIYYRYLEIWFRRCILNPTLHEKLNARLNSGSPEKPIQFNYFYNRMQTYTQLIKGRDGAIITATNQTGSGLFWLQTD